VKHLIVGGAGQDGTLLTAQLLSQGQNVHPLGLKPGLITGTRYIVCDVNNHEDVKKYIKEIRPDRIYYFAAHHKSSEQKELDFQEDLKLSLQTNTDSFVNVLDQVLKYSPSCRVLYASSCRIFGEGKGDLLTEDSPYRPVCTYGVSKVMAMEIAKLYRKEKNLFVSSAILFNHESELRPKEFLTRKILTAVLEARKIPDTKIEVMSLDSLTDWGYARDYVRGMKMMLDLDEPDDFILGSGQLHTVQYFIETAFSLMGLNWQNHVTVNPAINTPKKWMLRGSSQKLQSKSNWTSQYDFVNMIQDILNRIEIYDKMKPFQFQSYL